MILFWAALAKLWAGWMMYMRPEPIIEFAAKHRLPAVYPGRGFTDAGGLMSYAPNTIDLFRRSATYVAKLFQGAKSAELPVEQPTRFDLLINLKTAKALGLTIPPSLLGRADQVIEQPVAAAPSPAAKTNSWVTSR